MYDRVCLLLLTAKDHRQVAEHRGHGYIPMHYLHHLDHQYIAPIKYRGASFSENGVFLPFSDLLRLFLALHTLQVQS